MYSGKFFHVTTCNGEPKDNNSDRTQGKILQAIKALNSRTLNQETMQRSANAVQDKLLTVMDKILIKLTDTEDVEVKEVEYGNQRSEIRRRRHARISR